MSARSIGALFLSSVCTYSGWIEYNERRHKSHKQRSLKLVIDNRRLSSANNITPNSTTTMVTPTSTDNMIFDSLNTGDVVLFHRDWYRYHIPIAFLILSNQYFQKYDYDHCGVVVQDKYGEVYLFENTPLGGYRICRLDERLHYSKSSQVTVIPLLPRISFTNPINEAKMTNLSNKIGLMTNNHMNDNKSNKTCEITDWLRSFYDTIPNLYHSEALRHNYNYGGQYEIKNSEGIHVDHGNKVTSNGSTSISNKHRYREVFDVNVTDKYIIHPNAVPIIECYDALNIRPVTSSSFSSSSSSSSSINSKPEISIKTIAEGSIEFIYSQDAPAPCMKMVNINLSSYDEKMRDSKTNGLNKPKDPVTVNKEKEEEEVITKYISDIPSHLSTEIGPLQKMIFGPQVVLKTSQNK